VSLFISEGLYEINNKANTKSFSDIKKYVVSKELSLKINLKILKRIIMNKIKNGYTFFLFNLKLIIKRKIK
jgi:hypothetical protein